MTHNYLPTAALLCCLGQTLLPVAHAQDHAQNEATPDSEAIPRQPAAAQNATSGAAGNAKNWIDNTHSYVSNSADDLANWIDHFFGAQRDDIESADSSLRLTLENDWEESEGIDTDVRLRGKVHLPRIDERLSLLFTDEEGETREQEGENVDELAGQRETTRISLQYKAKEKKRYRIDYRLGLRSSLKARASVRYRYQLPVGDSTTHRLTETLYFIDGEGFGSRTQYEYDHLLERGKLFRWTNSIRFSEDTDGVDWSTRLILGEKRDDNSALNYFTWLRGETRPKHYTKSYGLGMRYRRNFYRSWLYYELEPAYAWKRDELEHDREGILLFTVRLEILLVRPDEHD